MSHASNQQRQQRLRDLQQKWRLDHPYYQREYKAKGGAKILKIKVPLVKRLKGQLPYQVISSKPLSMEERVQHETKKPLACTNKKDGDEADSIFGADAEGG